MIRSIVWTACAVIALAMHTPVARGTESPFDSPSAQPVFGSPGTISEAERSLAPPVYRVPLDEAIGTTLSRRDDVRPAAAVPSNRSTTWERRAFAIAALVALACVALGTLAALMTIARGR